MIRIQCKQCHDSYAVTHELAGRTVRCRECGERLTVPARSMFRFIRLLVGGVVALAVAIALGLWLANLNQRADQVGGFANLALQSVTTPSTPPPTLIDKGTGKPLEIEATLLAVAFDADPFLADEKLKGKAVIVTGEVDGTGFDVTNRPYILFGNPLVWCVQCSFHDTKGIMDIHPGDMVKIMGTVYGKLLTTVSVQECRLVEKVEKPVKKVEPPAPPAPPAPKKRSRRSVN
jgi:predicted Zn finger-like uncharacterized protein